MGSVVGDDVGLFVAMQESVGDDVGASVMGAHSDDMSVGRDVVGFLEADPYTAPGVGFLESYGFLEGLPVPETDTDTGFFVPDTGLPVADTGLPVADTGAVTGADTGADTGTGAGGAALAALTNFALSLAKSGDPSPVVGSHPTVA